MKLNETKAIKNCKTFDLDAAYAVINGIREDEYTVKDYAKIAARIASGKNDVEVLQCDAEIVRNFRVCDAIAEGSKNMDVWIRFKALCGNVFVMGGACLTDIWDCSVSNKDEIKSRMFIRKFIEE